MEIVLPRAVDDVSAAGGRRDQAQEMAFDDIHHVSRGKAALEDPRHGAVVDPEEVNPVAAENVVRAEARPRKNRDDVEAVVTDVAVHELLGGQLGIEVADSDPLFPR